MIEIADEIGKIMIEMAVMIDEYVGTFNFFEKSLCIIYLFVIIYFTFYNLYEDFKWI